MPSAMKTPGPFPGLDQLPDNVRNMLELLFPQEPDISPAMPGTVITGRAIKALDPLLRGSLQRGQEIAADVVKNLPGPDPSTLPAPARKLVETLQQRLEPPDVAKLASLDKVTGTRPPTQTFIKPGPNMYFAQKQYKRPPTIREQKMPNMRRDPLVEELAKRWRSFDAAQDKAGYEAPTLRNYQADYYDKFFNPTNKK